MSLTYGQNTNGVLNQVPFGLLPLPQSLSPTYTLQDVAYDYAIGGIPFLAGESLRGQYFRRVYTREFAPIRKDQFDNQQVPGEQSILGWWLRSQSSFIQGAGTQYLDTTTDTTLSQRYFYSEGVDTLSTPGQVSLLQGTKVIATGLHGNVRLRGARLSGNDGVLGLDVAGGTLMFYSVGGMATTYAIPGGLTLANTFTDDGTNYYFASTTAIYKGVIATPLVAPTIIWNLPGTGNTRIAWVKGRLVLCQDNSVYELTSGGPALPAAKFSHLNTSYTYTDISETPTAILVSGFAGSISQVHKFTLDSQGAMPTMSSGVVTTTMPIGENILSMYAYIGSFVGIGTNKGFRVAQTDTNANLIYGPLIVQDPTMVGVLAVGGYDRFLYIGNQANRLIPQQGWVNPTDASVVDMLMRIDLSQTTSTNSQPFANDLMTSGTDGNITSITNAGTSSLIAFATGTKIWVADSANKQSSGFIYTPKIRYNTLEPKHFKYVYMRSQKITDGSIDIYGQSTTTGLQSLALGVTGLMDPTNPVSILDMGNSQEWMQFKFILHRGTLSTNYSPIWNGYQLRALPGVNRQIVLTVPLICHDKEMDKYGNLNGYDGYAWARLLALEAVIQSGNVVLFQDLNYNVSSLVVVDNYKFEQQSPETGKTSTSGNADANSHGGYIILTCRVIQ